MENYKPKPILPTPEEEEIWKQHPIYSEYEVSTFGRVRRIKNQYIMTGTPNGKGYLVVHLRAGIDHPNGVYARIHKMVAETFYGLGKPGLEVDHLDRNRQNNYYKNLRWATHMENIKNTSKKRRQKIYMNGPEIVLLNKETNELIREFKNLQEIVDELKLSPSSVRENIHGRRPPYTIGYFMIKEEYLQKNI